MSKNKANYNSSNFTVIITEFLITQCKLILNVKLPKYWQCNDN